MYCYLKDDTPAIGISFNQSGNILNEDFPIVTIRWVPFTQKFHA